MSATYTGAYPSGKKMTFVGELRVTCLPDGDGVIVAVFPDDERAPIMVFDPRAVVSTPMLGVVYTPHMVPLDAHAAGIRQWLAWNPGWAR